MDENEEKRSHPKKKRSTGSTNRTKGHVAERYYVNIFKELGFSYCVSARLGSRLYDNAKIDLINLPLNIQVKAGIQKGMNPGKELYSMNCIIKDVFPPHDAVHTFPKFVIHKKEVEKGVYRRGPEHEIVYMSKAQFMTYLEDNPNIPTIFEKVYKYNVSSEFSHIIGMTFEVFKEEIIKKLYKDGSICNP